jgi:thioredoxin-like negative regulator of GroEL
MKILKITVLSLSLAALAVIGQSCGSKADKADNQAAQEQAQKDETAEAENEEGTVVELENDATYRAGQSYGQPVILDFNATWCGPCKAFRPTFDEYAKKYGNEITFVSVDIDKNPETAASFGVQQIPHVVYIDADGNASKVEVSDFPALFE